MNFLFTVSHSSSMDCRYSILCLCDLSSLTVNGSGSVFSAPDWTLLRSVTEKAYLMYGAVSSLAGACGPRISSRESMDLVIAFTMCARLSSSPSSPSIWLTTSWAMLAISSADSGLTIGSLGRPSVVPCICMAIVAATCESGTMLYSSSTSRTCALKSDTYRA